MKNKYDSYRGECAIYSVMIRFHLQWRVLIYLLLIKK